jgi:hypothetical protein
MRFSLALVGLLLLTLESLPAFGSPVYVHARTKKAKKHKVPKHRTVQQ